MSNNPSGGVEPQPPATPEPPRGGPGPYPTPPVGESSYQAPYGAQSYPAPPAGAPPYPAGPYGAPYPAPPAGAPLYPAPYGGPGGPPAFGQPGPYGPVAPYGQVPGYPAPYPSAAPAPAQSALPTEPREYQQVLRGPRHRWWRPIVSLLLVIGIGLPLIVLATVLAVIAALLAGAPNVAAAVQRVSDLENIGPTGFIFINLSLIVLIPTTFLAVWIAHGVHPRYLSSVAGGLRWRWLARCLLIVAPIWLVYLGLSLLVETPEGARPPYWGVLLVIVVLMTPFQAAAEEYLFRGWIMQSLGSWFRGPVLAFVVTTLLSAGLFGAAHGSLNLWVLLDIALLAVASCLIAWRTGGLEGGIVIHAVNNVFVFFVVIIFGGFSEAFVSQSTTSTPVAFLIALVVYAAVVALILWQAKKLGIDRWYRPPGTVPPAGGPPLPAAQLTGTPAAPPTAAPPGD